VSDKLGKTLWEILGVAAIAAGTNVTIDKLKEHGSKTSSDERAELLEELRLMSPEEKENLLRRHREAISTFQEQRFVRLLCKVRQDPQEGRRPTLKYLNDLSDQEFEQMVCLLDDGLSSKIDAAAGRAASHLRQIGSKIDAALAPLADKLEEREQRRKS
jgi:aminopeptidase-like protein